MFGKKEKWGVSAPNGRSTMRMPDTGHEHCPLLGPSWALYPERTLLSPLPPLPAIMVGTAQATGLFQQDKKDTKSRRRQEEREVTPSERCDEGQRKRARRETNTADLREDIIDTHDAVGPGGAAVVNHGGVALHPHPAAQLGQQPVVFGGDLALHKHCKNKVT